MVELIRLSDFHWPITVEKFRAAHPDVGLPDKQSILEQVDWSSFGYARILPTPMPVYDPLTQTVRAVTPIKTDGKWYQQWEIVALTPEQIAAMQVAAAVAARVCVGGFFDRFGDQKIPILASTDPVVQAIVKDASVRQYITLTRPDLAQTLDILIAKGFAIDKDRVLSLDITEEERP